MLLQQFTPHIITSASLFLAIFVHWKVKDLIVRPSLTAGTLTAVIALIIVFGLQTNYLNFDPSATTVADWIQAAMAVAGLGFFYGVIIALLVGYCLKVAPSFFD